MDTLYRIYTEDINPLNIKSALIEAEVSGYTLLSGNGSWEGILEPALIIEVLASSPDKVLKAAELIKAYNRQQTVLLTSTPVQTTLV
jgi:hypothetical protein